jgi:hypothetical protein
MEGKLLAGEPNCHMNNCPNIRRVGDEWRVQGRLLAEQTPDGEAVVAIPAVMGHEAAARDTHR